MSEIDENKPLRLSNIWMINDKLSVDNLVFNYVRSESLFTKVKSAQSTHIYNVVRTAHDTTLFYDRIIK
jgi:hypothetical protein